jgi:hypothetical protein
MSRRPWTPEALAEVCRRYPHERTADIDRAKAVADVAQVMINSAKVEVEFMKATGGLGSGFIENTGRPAPLKAVGGGRND